MKYPYSDDFMKFDEPTQRYILTEQDVRENLDINLQKRLLNSDAINTVLRQVSTQVYSYIHKFNANNRWQDYVISKTKKGREIIKEAMEQQLIYFLTNGDLSRSTDPNKRLLWFDETAKETLMQPIPEIGCSICYTGYMG